MQEKAKKTIASLIKSLAQIITGSAVVVSVLVWVFSPHIDSYLEKKFDSLHEHEEFIRIGIIIKDGRELYIASDGKEYNVIHGEDGIRWWYDGTQMKQIYK